MPVAVMPGAGKPTLYCFSAGSWTSFRGAALGANFLSVHILSVRKTVTYLGFMKMVLAFGIKWNMLTPRFSVYLGEGKLVLEGGYRLE